MEFIKVSRTMVLVVRFCVWLVSKERFDWSERVELVRVWSCRSVREI